MEHLETSLKELGTDYLDIWYMHARDTVAAIPDEQIAVWENAKKQGRSATSESAPTTPPPLWTASWRWGSSRWC